MELKDPESGAYKDHDSGTCEPNNWSVRFRTAEREDNGS